MKLFRNDGPLFNWMRRYLPAEIVSSACAILVTWLVYQLTEHVLLAALANTASGSISFYVVMLVCSLRGRSLRDMPRVVCDLVLEFGPAEALDTLLLRPALLYAGVTFFPNPALGVLLAKLVADLCFYAPAIISYELLRRRHKVCWQMGAAA